MELDELKKFLKIDGDSLDMQLIGYQLASEIYLQNAGVSKDYSDGLYKIVITILVGTFLENPTLLVIGASATEIKNLTLNGIIAQMRSKVNT